MMVRIAGLALSLAYAALIVWLYAAQPQTLSEVTGGLASTVGAYSIDERAMGEGLAAFRADRFDEARAAFARADPARRDARVQFYIAYSYYRQGWGRFYSDDALYAKGLEAVDRAIAIAPAGQLTVDDPDLGLRTPGALRTELVEGQTRELSDFNPVKAFRRRQ